MTHYSLPLDTPLGSVLVAVDAPLEHLIGESAWMPAVQVSARANDPAVYGIFNGWRRDDMQISAAVLQAVLAARPWLRDRIVDMQPIEPAPALAQDRVTLRRPLADVPGAYQEREEIWAREKRHVDGGEWSVLRREPIPAEPPGEPMVQLGWLTPSTPTVGVTGVLVIGPCEMGDLLVSSDTPGCAMAATHDAIDPRFIIAKALGVKTDHEPARVRARVRAG